MVYSNKFVACVIVDGKIAREIRNNDGDSVYLPFGTEYELRLKNKDTRRAVVSVEIDGQSALGGTQLVIEPNSESDLKGFLDAASNIARNRFRITEKTEQISEFRGDRVDDGLIRIEWQFEKAPLRSRLPMRKWPGWSSDPGLKKGGRRPEWPEEPRWMCNNSSDGRVETQSFGENIASSGILRSKGLSPASVPDSSPVITVAGSIVNQKFGSTEVGELESEKFAIVIQLRGIASSGEKVEAPLLVRTKTQCPNCGDMNSSGHKFCAGCGTCLI